MEQFHALLIASYGRHYLAQRLVANTHGQESPEGPLIQVSTPAKQHIGAVGDRMLLEMTSDCSALNSWIISDWAHTRFSMRDGRLPPLYLQPAAASGHQAQWCTSSCNTKWSLVFKVLILLVLLWCRTCCIRHFKLHNYSLLNFISAKIMPISHHDYSSAWFSDISATRTLDCFHVPV